MIDVDALLASVDLLSIVRKDVQLKRVATGRDGPEYAGPCPFCGAGTDRFRCWPRHSAGRGRWWCRRCDRSGDGITYLQERDGLSFKEAAQALGGDVDQVRTSKRPPAPRRSPRAAVPQVEPPGPAWQERARAFVSYAQEYLWSRPGQPALEYLRAERGLSDDTIQHYGLGLYPLGSFKFNHDRRIEDWGVEDTDWVTLPDGIVIPCEIEDCLWYVQVRRPYMMDNDSLDTLSAYLGYVNSWRAAGKTMYNRAKYTVVTPHAATALFGADDLRGAPGLLVCESQFDAMLVWQLLGDLVDVTAIGPARSWSNGIPGRWLLRILPYQRLFVALDPDSSGVSGAAALARRDRRVVRVQVPDGGDLVGFWQQGGDLRGWLREILNELD